MPDISPSEYIDSLLIAYRHAEKFYNLAVADVSAAEVRRDEAKKIKDEALERLENAREKYETLNAQEKYERPEVRKDRSPWTNNTPTYVPSLKHIRPPTSPTRNTTPTRSSTPTRDSSLDSGEKEVVRRTPIKKAIAESESSRKIRVEKAEDSEVDANVEGASQGEQRHSLATPDIILSPTTEDKKSPKTKKAMAESGSSRKIILDKAEKTAVNPDGDTAIQEVFHTEQQPSMAPPDGILSQTTGQKRAPTMKKAIAESESSRNIDVEKAEESVVNPNVEAAIQEVSQSDIRQSIVPPEILSPNTGHKRVPKMKKAIGGSESSRKIVVEKGEKSALNPNVEAAIQDVSQREQRQSSVTPDIILSPPVGHKKSPKMKKATAESGSSRNAEESVVNTSVEEAVQEVSQSDVRQPILPPDIILSPTAGHKKAPKIFLTNPESPRRRSSTGIVSSLPPMEATKGVLTLTQGRSRDWFDKNFDCEAHGLVKRFYQATFSTKTNEKTKKVTVKTIVLNDESNDLVSDTSEIQEMYIGKSPDNDTKPTFRDKVAEALVNPPQQEPLALFFAPKHTLKTNEVYYGGHWKVIDGEMLQPPQLVKGQLRQCRVRFAFVGIDRQIIEAINKGI